MPSISELAPDSVRPPLFLLSNYQFGGYSRPTSESRKTTQRPRSQLVRIARPTSAQGSIVTWLLLSSVGWGRSPKFYYSMGQAPSIWGAYNDIAVHRTSHAAAVPDAYPL